MHLKSILFFFGISNNSRSHDWKRKRNL